MPIESWTKPEETPALAAHARAMIDAALTGTGLAPDFYWAAVRKGYNTPYNDPPRKEAALPEAGAILEIAVEAGPPVIPAAIAAALPAEARAV